MIVPDTKYCNPEKNSDIVFSEIRKEGMYSRSKNLKEKKREREYRWYWVTE